MGAQYVASLDPTVAGMLADMPRIGAAMLFARVDDRGRVSLVRTGVVTHFERHQEEGPFSESELPSHSVETSAPVLEPPRSSQVADREMSDDDLEDEEDPYTDEVERTRPINILDPAALRGLRKSAFVPPPASSGPTRNEDEDADEDDDMLERTAEYESQAARRARESQSDRESDGEVISATPPTLRRAPKDVDAEPYTTRPRTSLAPTPRRSGVDRSEEPTNVGDPRPLRVDSNAHTIARTPRPSLPIPATERLAVRGRRER